MKTNPIIIAALMALTLAACGGGDNNSLAGKREELTKLKSEQSATEAKIKALEGEMGKLDTTAVREDRAVAVTVSPVANENFKHYVEVQGSVDAKNTVMVSPKSGGVLTAVYIKEGDNVRQGATLAKVDNSIMQESIAEVQNQLALANTVFEKQSRLWEQKIGTEIQYLQAKNNKESLEKKITTLNTQLGQSNITAPISGVVDQVIAKVGEMAAPGSPVARVVNLSNLKIVAKVSDSYVATVKKGDEVIVKFPDLDQEYKARITFVSTTVDPLSRTFRIEANLPSTNSIKPNMLATVQINDATKKDALVIDQNVVQNTENGTVVYVAENDGGKKIAKSRVVKTGLSYNGQIEILAGLKAGDQLITQGYQDVADGQAVIF